MSDPFRLQRFLDAQQGVYPVALQELRAGRKTSHWMWYVFPQIAGLGRSSAAVRYSISGLAEARAYIEHPVLGARLLECCDTLLNLEENAPEAILGNVDALKLRSSLTLFDQASGMPLFKQLLHKYYDGQADQATLERLRAQPVHFQDGET